MRIRLVKSARNSWESGSLSQWGREDGRMGGDLSSVVFKKFLITKRIQNSAEDRGTRKPSKYPESATPILGAICVYI